MTSRTALACGLIAALALPGAYVALGGRGTQAADAVSDPCVTREWRSPEGAERVTEQIALSAFDGAACDLGVTREALVLALATSDNRAEFAREHGLTDERISEAARSGLDRAVADAVAAGALSQGRADLLRQIVALAPLDLLLDAIATLS